MVKLVTRVYAYVWGALAIACVLPSQALADSLPDPTRPPAELNAVGSSAASAEEGKWVLQSVLISPSIKSAIIAGQTVDIGERYRGAKLVEISETGVLLQTGKAVRTLKLFPELVKHPASQPEEAVPGTTLSVPRKHTGKKARRKLTGKAE
jgi:MSHA biogenesis protein MshK